jgi:hypothetical protein
MSDNTEYDFWDFGGGDSGFDFSGDAGNVSWDFDTGLGEYTATQADLEAMANLGYTPAQIAGAESTLGDLISKAGAGILGLFKDKQGNIDWRKVATAGGGVLGLIQSMRGGDNAPATYKGGIPTYTASRAAVGQTYDPTRRPGSMGQRYFSDVSYTAPAEATAAKASAVEQAKALEAENVAREATRKAQEASPNKAMGGLTTLAKGRYLRGETDGMEDKIPAHIEGKQPAALSHGEFVVPADVVSHLGNGNSDAGAKRLYDMMDRIRQARTGTPKQGKQINANKYLPA